VGYQDHNDEVAIVLRRAPATDAQWVDKVVEVVRRTRQHADLRNGSSVRGAIDTALVAAQLGSLRSLSSTNSQVGLDAALTALSGRVRVREGVSRSAEDIVTEIWTDVFRVVADSGDAGKATAPSGATTTR
jgi:MoxR-like ATPase